MHAPATAPHTDETDRPTGPINQRRRLVKTLGLGALISAGLPLASPPLAGAADSSGKAKVVFVLFRRSDLTHEQSMAEWKGIAHVAIVKKIPSLLKWVQNHPVSAPGAGLPDAIGELWFADAEAMGKAMNSPEMAAAGEDAKRFLDMEKTFAVVVSEKTFVG